MCRSSSWKNTMHRTVRQATKGGGDMVAEWSHVFQHAMRKILGEFSVRVGMTFVGGGCGESSERFG